MSSGLICERCAFDESCDRPPFALPLRTVLHDRYIAGKILGTSESVITYLGWDRELMQKIAIKEYLSRGAGSGTETRGGGPEKFLSEGRKLARFQTPGVESVQTLFEENSNAYLTLGYGDGETFEKYLHERGERLPFEVARRMLTPVMEALQQLHSAGILHRNIHPNNLLVSRTDQIKVIGMAVAPEDFRSCGVSNSFESAFLALEQSRAEEEGPWTDVYGFAATFYRAIAGEAPPSAIRRESKDELISPSALGAMLPQHVERTLLKALSLRAPDRYQTINEMCADLRDPEMPPMLITPGV